MHDFVQKLMESDFINNKEGKIQLIKNLVRGFVGLKGFDDEIVLTQVLNLIIQRLIPEDENNGGTLCDQKRR
jgi:hypothetical protein